MDKLPAISTVRDVIVAGAAVSTATVGWKALNKWRDETVGKRRLEVAEDTLSAFYQVQEVIYDARSPMIWASEMVKEEGVPDEVVGNSAYGPVRRLRQSFDHIRDLRTKRHRFAALFGREATKPWDEIEGVLNEINAASETILMLRGEHIPATDPQAKFYREQRRILARQREDDPITPRVDAAVKGIEAVCRPIIRAWGRT
ncbi:hypothetical protein MKK88_09595 [Methylobacterium sp. E-005]|uniref:hypothetical protein n=1 Tax=Methylobacterium sp. E-005 TaxID=2836549 RepID=UPI001FBAA6C0|nr:hypothetical protein [Methylobacterium sp. E-005]MCJ2086247.1 hypothetical protein [Methylobacterium sp. E-005]